MSEVLKKFGKYFLLDMIAQGGMAEIYRARTATPDGGARLVAIKRVLTTYSQNPEFVSMFKTEINTAGGFSHPNIVQIFDYGEEQSQLFLAMELVDGRSVRQILSRVIEQKKKMPIENIIFIAEQASSALSYIHNFKDRLTGQLMNIIHRDISPQNILISYDGGVKLIDFGIAKAATTGDSTRAGLIKGKPSYLSPEQISGETLDGRSDIFSLGAVIWEMLAGRKLFSGENDFNIIKLIENCTTHIKPPSSVNPGVPSELDAIVMKALHKNRDLRYQNAEEMQKALRKLLYQKYIEFTPNEVSQFCKELFKEEIVNDRKFLSQLNEKSKVLLGESSELTRDSGSFRVVDFKEQEKSLSQIEIDVDPSVKSVKSNPSVKSVPSMSGSNSRPAYQRQQGYSNNTSGAQKKSESSSALSKVALLIIGVGLLGGYLYVNNTKATRAPGEASKRVGALVIRGNVQAATVLINSRQVATALPVTLPQVDADIPLMVKVQSNGFITQTREVQITAGEKRQLEFTLEREGSDYPSSNFGKTLATVRFNIQPVVTGAYTEIRVGNKSIDPLTAIAEVPVGESIEVFVIRESFRPLKKVILIKESDFAANRDQVVNIVLEPARYGFLSLKTTPSADALLVIDGVEEHFTTPVSQKRIPIGKYKVRLVNELLGMEKTIDIEILEDRFTSREVRLSGSQD